MSFKLITRKFYKGPNNHGGDLKTFIITEEYRVFKQGVETGNEDNVRIAIANGVDVNLLIGNASKEDSKHAIEIVCENGYWQILDLLLNCPSLKFDFKKLDSLLCIVSRNLTKDRINETKSNFRACFKRLLEDSRVDVNLTDYRGNTPLHYTVEYKCDELTKVLLERGAYIGMKNLKNKLPIDGIDYQILHDFFDSQMTSNYNKNNRICNDFEINLDYSFLIKKPNKHNIYSQNTDQFYPIEYISRSNQLKELLSHPIIRYLIWMKSETLSPIFVIWNLTLFVAFFLTIIYITFFNIGEGPDSNTFILQHNFIYILTRSATWFCIVVLIIYLAVQFPIVIRHIRITYGKWRFLNELCIVLLLLIVFKFESYTPAKPTNLNRQATAVCILLIAIDMNLLMITVPKFKKIAIHFLMLQKISRQFLTVLLFYMIILVAFSLSFHVLDDNIFKRTTVENLNNLGEKFIRIIGMMIGELNLQFDNLLLVYYILTLLFIFLITIVLINILNGLAVSDISEIQLTAKLIYLVCRIQIIVRYEKYFLRNVIMRKFIFNLIRYKGFFSFTKRLKITLNQYVKTVKIYPNRYVTMVNNISRPAAPDAESDTYEWPKVSKNIVNELIEHFEKKLEAEKKDMKEYEFRIILNEINQKLDQMKIQQTKFTVPTYKDVRLNIGDRNVFL